MTIMHGQAKTGLTQISQGQLKRTASVALSPPKKKTKDPDSRDNLVQGLEIKNENLIATIKTKQDLIKNQANIIGELREKIYGLEIKKNEEKTQEYEMLSGHLIEMDKVNQERLNDLKNIISNKEIIISNIEQENSNTNTKIVTTPKMKEYDPNLKELPQSVKALVEDGSKEYVKKETGHVFLERQQLIQQEMKVTVHK